MEYHPIVRQQVRFFCSDMRSGFSKVARACFPHAKICIDLFHVVKLLAEAISSIRVTSWRSLNDKASSALASANAFKENGDTASYERKKIESKKLKADADLVKNSQRVLVTSPYNESAYWNRNAERRQERLHEIFSIAPDLKTAYEALEEFYILSSIPAFKGQRNQLSEWIEKYRSCDIPEVHQAARSIEVHRKGIENSWRYNKSNGPTEGLNRKIKDCRRMAFGAHDFENFRKRVLMACGSCKVFYTGYTVFNEKMSSYNDHTEAHNDQNIPSDFGRQSLDLLQRKSQALRYFFYGIPGL
jgi:transposase